MNEYFTWKDIDINFGRNTSGDLNANEGIDAIYGSLRNIIMTIQTTRRMLPLFALDLYGKLFEPMTEQVASDIGNIIAMAVQKWEPRIRLTDVLIEGDYDNNQYKVTLKFYIALFGKQENLYEFIDIIQAG